MQRTIFLCLLLTACATSRRGKSLGEVTVGYEVEEVVRPFPDNPSPCYPLGFEKIGGRVDVKFMVDTTGRVEVETIEIVLATHTVFIRPVLDVLPQHRFVPAWLKNAQRKVRREVIEPFVFLAEGASPDSIAASSPKTESCKK